MDPLSLENRQLREPKLEIKKLSHYRRYGN